MSIQKMDFEVSVTLSKQTTSSPPHMVMHLELRQKIFCFRKRRWANEVVAVRAAGRMGGTTTVNRSNELRMISAMVPCNEFLIQTCSFVREISFLFPLINVLICGNDFLL